VLAGKQSRCYQDLHDALDGISYKVRSSRPGTRHPDLILTSRGALAESIATVTDEEAESMVRARLYRRADS
jgi:hypothetical protein